MLPETSDAYISVGNESHAHVHSKSIQKGGPVRVEFTRKWDECDSSHFPRQKSSKALSLQQQCVKPRGKIATPLIYTRHEASTPKPCVAFGRQGSDETSLTRLSQDVIMVLQQCPYIDELELARNPVSKIPKYRSCITMIGLNLGRPTDTRYDMAV